MFCEKTFSRTGLAPLDPCSIGVARRLNRKDPECWSFTVSPWAAVPVICVPVAFTGALAAIGVAARQVMFLIPISVFLLIVFAVCWKKRSSLLTPRFDFGAKCFYRSWSRARSGEADRLTDYHPFSDLEEVQLVGKMVSRSKGGPVPGYELNLFLRDGTGLPVCGAGKRQPLEADARELARALDLPLAIDVTRVVLPDPLSIWARIVLPLIFCLLGSFLLGYRVLLPLYRNGQSASWVEAPAKIVSSRLLSEKRKNKNTTYTVYKAELFYNYKFKKRLYSSGRYDMFSDDYNSDYVEQHRRVRENPPGKELRCFVNPLRPSEAVLSREVPRTALLIEGSLFSFITAMGAVILLYALCKRRKRGA